MSTRPDTHQPPTDAATANATASVVVPAHDVHLIQRRSAVPQHRVRLVVVRDYGRQALSRGQHQRLSEPQYGGMAPVLGQVHVFTVARPAGNPDLEAFPVL